MTSNALLTYKVIFDTGSTQMWLPGSQCNQCFMESIGLDCVEYNCTEEVRIQYSVGSLIGNKVTGQVAIDDQFHQSSFILANTVSHMEGAMYEGIVGLQDNSNHAFIEWPIGFYYGFSNNAKMSSITFGGYDESLFELPIIYLDTQPLWKIECQQIEATNIIVQNVSVMIDSGSSLIMFPKTVLQLFYADFATFHCELQGILKCPCPTHDLSIFPTITFTLNGSLFTLEPQYYVHSNLNDPICHILVSNYAAEDGLVVLGSPFMRKYYTIFDKQQSRIGLVPSIAQSEVDINFPFHKMFLILACIGSAVAIIKIVNILIEYELSKNQKSIIV